MIKSNIFGRLALLAAGCATLATGAAAPAQTVPDVTVPSTGLDIPENLQIFGKIDPNVRKPTAIINGYVLTGTDVDQRMNLIITANEYKLNDKEREQLRMIVLRGLIDEVLQIQEAKANKVVITPAKITEAYNRVAVNFKQDPNKFGAYLRSIGSSERSIRRQIEGELAWQGYLRRTVDINVSKAEVDSIIDKIVKDKGTEEYHLREIYMDAIPGTETAVYKSMQDMMAEMRTGKQTFAYFARTKSVSTTSEREGDLGWVRAAMIPTELATAAGQMQVGQLAGPIPVPGGFSVLYLEDKRTIGQADPRNAKLSLKQIKITFPAGTTDAQAKDKATEFGKFVDTLTGCGNANLLAAKIGAEVVDNDTLTIKQLPGPLQEILLKLQVGQATPPFGSVAEGVSTLIMCGRDEAKADSLPSAEQIQYEQEQKRINLRAQKILRDLRRDAVIEYR